MSGEAEVTGRLSIEESAMITTLFRHNLKYYKDLTVWKRHLRTVFWILSVRNNDEDIGIGELRQETETESFLAYISEYKTQYPLEAITPEAINQEINRWNPVYQHVVRQHVDLTGVNLAPDFDHKWKEMATIEQLDAYEASYVTAMTPRDFITYWYENQDRTFFVPGFAVISKMYYDWVGNERMQSTYNKLPIKPNQAWKLLLHRMIQLDVVDHWKLRAATDLTGITDQMIRGQTIVYEARVREQRIEAIRLREAPVVNEVPGTINIDTEATVVSELVRLPQLLLAD